MENKKNVFDRESNEGENLKLPEGTDIYTQMNNLYDDICREYTTVRVSGWSSQSEKDYTVLLQEKLEHWKTSQGEVNHELLDLYTNMIELRLGTLARIHFRTDVNLPDIDTQEGNDEWSVLVNSFITRVVLDREMLDTQTRKKRNAKNLGKTMFIEADVKMVFDRYKDHEWITPGLVRDTFDTNYRTIESTLSDLDSVYESLVQQYKEDEFMTPSLIKKLCVKYKNNTEDKITTFIQDYYDLCNEYGERIQKGVIKYILINHESPKDCLDEFIINYTKLSSVYENSEVITEGFLSDECKLDINYDRLKKTLERCEGNYNSLVEIYKDDVLVTKGWIGNMCRRYNTYKTTAKVLERKIEDQKNQYYELQELYKKRGVWVQDVFYRRSSSGGNITNAMIIDFIQREPTNTQQRIEEYLRSDVTYNVFKRRTEDSE